MDAAEEIINGTIGEGTTKEFSHFLDIYDKLPPIDKILDGTYTLPPDPRKPDVIHALIGVLVSRLKEDSLTNYLNYVKKIEPADFFALAIKEAANSGWKDKIVNHPLWKTIAKEIRVYLQSE
jgi:hypothetical protein